MRNSPDLAPALRSCPASGVFSLIAQIRSLQRPDLSDRVVDPLQISKLGEAPELCARYIVNVRRYWPRLRRSRAAFELRRFRARWASSDTSRARVTGHAGFVTGHEVDVTGHAGHRTPAEKGRPVLTLSRCSASRGLTSGPGRGVRRTAARTSDDDAGRMTTKSSDQGRQWRGESTALPIDRAGCLLQVALHPAG